MPDRPLAIDLYCGLGGWAEGLLAEGYDVVGFDIERHRYPARAIPADDGGIKLLGAPLTGGWIEYPAQLVIQDVLTLHGSQFRDAALIVASPPCQAYSYRAMPWKRAKALPPPDNTLFETCFRIQREACEAAGRHIPMIVENVRGAQNWVVRARWNYGSFYLWGDVPALMPMTLRAAKMPGHNMSYGSPIWGPHTTGGYGSPDGRKGGGGTWFEEYWPGQGTRNLSSAGSRRKAASAMIAKIPLPLARHIAAVYRRTADV